MPRARTCCHPRWSILPTPPHPTPHTRHCLICPTCAPARLCPALQGPYPAQGVADRPGPAHTAPGGPPPHTHTPPYTACTPVRPAPQGPHQAQGVAYRPGPAHTAPRGGAGEVAPGEGQRLLRQRQGLHRQHWGGPCARRRQAHVRAGGGVARCWRASAPRGWNEIRSWPPAVPGWERSLEDGGAGHGACYRGLGRQAAGLVADSGAVAQPSSCTCPGGRAAAVRRA